MHWTSKYIGSICFRFLNLSREIYLLCILSKLESAIVQYKMHFLKKYILVINTWNELKSFIKVGDPEWPTNWTSTYLELKIVD